MPSRGTETPLHFALTETQVKAVIALVNGLDEAGGLPASHPLTTTANALDEQMASQNRAWEKCQTCNGTGWVEE